MKKSGRILAWLLITPVLLVGASTAIYHLRKNHLSAHESAELAALNALGKTLPDHCDVYRDARQIPHVQTTTELHAWACLGLLQARDRGWQLQYYRRAAHGSLAEVLGPSLLKSDYGVKLLQLTDRAQQLTSQFPEEIRQKLQAYSYGINRGLNPLSYEFAALGDSPRPWLPQDSVAILLLQSFTQTRRGIEADLQEESRLQTFGENAPKLFDEEGTPWSTTIIKDDELGAHFTAASTAIPAVPRSPVARAEELSAFFSAGMPPGETGSNSWVLSRARSATGNAWLANDPHLEVYYPPLWHWTHLSVKGSRFETMAGSLPGTPVFANGTNGRIAWGLTNSYMKVSDVYHVPADEMKNAKTGYPLLWFKFWGMRLPFIKSARWTSEGLPVLPITDPPAPAGMEKILRWSGFYLSAAELTAFFDLPTAANADEADSIFARLKLPTWNYVFADQNGDIGYRGSGKLPKRRAETYGIPAFARMIDGKIPSWDYLNPDESPHLRNPKRGWIATANNRQWSSRAPYSLGLGQTMGFRAFRVEELLAATPKHDFNSNRRAQCDTQSMDSRMFFPLLFPVLQKIAEKNKSERLRDFLAQLERWKASGFETRADCEACGVFRVWARNFGKRSQLTEPALFRKLSETPDSLAPMIEEELMTALNSAAYGKKWGDLHRAPFQHLSKAPELDRDETLFTPGDDRTVSPGTAEWNGKIFPHTNGASQRIIVELSRPVKIYLGLAGPNVNVAHPVLAGKDSAWQKWVDCETSALEFPVNFAEKTLERVAF